jgi:hypothetical protein
VSGAGRKANERERSGERDFRKMRGAGAERGAGDRGTGTERGAGVQKIGGAWSGILARSRSAHMLCSQTTKINIVFTSVVHVWR